MSRTIYIEDEDLIIKIYQRAIELGYNTPGSIESATRFKWLVVGSTGYVTGNLGRCPQHNLITLEEVFSILQMNSEPAYSIY